MKRTDLSRRDLLKHTSLAIAAGAVTSTGLANTLTTPAIGRTQTQGGSPNDRILIGLIGCAGMGSSILNDLMRFEDVEIVALCDVDDARIPKDFETVQTKYGRRPEVFKDYRSMLDRKDIDAVIIATPDHWHALQLIHACQAGKDSYCEKPISHNIVEAVAMAEAARRYRRVVQVGNWQRSLREFDDAIEFVRQGKMGRITLCRAWITDHFRAGRAQVTTPPSGLDYDMWTGPAAMVPYKPNHVHWNWRWFMNYGGGLTTDWGVHMMDIALLGMSKDQDLVMPNKVSAFGGRWAFPDDDRTAPDTTEAIMYFEDPEFIMHWSVKRDTGGLSGHCTEFVSADGRVVRVWRGGWQVLDGNGKELPKESLGRSRDHGRDFIDAMRNRSKPGADISSIAQTTIVCHLVNVALDAGTQVQWDKRRMDLVGRAGRNSLAYARPYRRPYSLPNYRPTGR